MRGLATATAIGNSPLTVAALPPLPKGRGEVLRRFSLQRVVPKAPAIRLHTAAVGTSKTRQAKRLWAFLGPGFRAHSGAIDVRVA